MKVCVQGLWHLGSVTAAGLASVGHQVVGLDLDEAAVRALKSGAPPVSEPGLAELVRKGLDSGALQFIWELEELPPDVHLLWVAYDTPVDADDVADVELVLAHVELVLPRLPAGATVLVSSQMPVGSIRRLEALARRLCPELKLGFACSPENLRLGKALDVFLKPDRVVVGVRGERDRARIEELLKPITDRIEWMSVESAEMTKHALNAFLATSVVFANEIATVCEMVGADAKEVERGLKSEQRIGPKAYLSPGGAFAGGTLARDVEFLKGVSHQHHLSVPLLESVKASNDAHKAWVRRKLESLFPTLEGVTVAVWGLTYKPGTDTLRRSMAVELCDWLLSKRARVRVHDPAVRELPPRWDGAVQRSADPAAALEGAQVLIVGTPWPLYREVSASAPGLVVLDPDRFLSAFATAQGIRYFAVGTPQP